jgi:hypothetical protein
MDCHRFDADPDPDPTFHFDADPDPDPSSSYTQVGKSDFFNFNACLLHFSSISQVS